MSQKVKRIGCEGVVPIKRIVISLVTDGGDNTTTLVTFDVFFWMSLFFYLSVVINKRRILKMHIMLEYNQELHFCDKTFDLFDLITLIKYKKGLVRLNLYIVRNHEMNENQWNIIKEHYYFISNTGYKWNQNENQS